MLNKPPKLKATFRKKMKTNAKVRPVSEAMVIIRRLRNSKIMGFFLKHIMLFL